MTEVPMQKLVGGPLTVRLIKPNVESYCASIATLFTVIFTSNLTKNHV